jgi:uncharacterized protein (TIGR02001 family)
MKGMVMKKTLKILGGAALMATLGAGPAFAIDGLTANGQFTTNYVLRGISQTANRPALQGGLDYDTGVGVTLGTWLSSLDFGDHTPLEWDLYGAYNFKVADVNLSVGGIGYIYPYSGYLGPYNYFEFTGTAAHDFGFASWVGKVYYDPFDLPAGFFDIKGVHPKHEFFLQTGVTIPVAPWLSLSGNIGLEGYDGAGTTNYAVWDLGATLTYDKYALDLRYIDTGSHIPNAVLAGTEALTGAPAFATGPFFVATFTFRFP